LFLLLAFSQHELTHGFDDQGRQYDGTGLLRPWWTAQSVAAFTQRATCLINQYSQFKIGEDHVNGNLTLGENIADNGGIRIAFNAYKKYIKDNGAEPLLPTKPAMSNEQLFFLSFAQGTLIVNSPLQVIGSKQYVANNN
jgi:predicted metalloendopeptidase